MKVRLAAASFAAVIAVAALAAVVVAVLAAVVLGLGDGAVFTPQPQTAAEQFVEKLASRRWEPARLHLTPEAAAVAGPQELKAALASFEQRWGAIEKVEGQPGPRGRDQAWATAVVTTKRGGPIHVPLPLERRSGVWRIAGNTALAPSS